LAQLLLEAMSSPGDPNEQLERVGFAFGQSLAREQIERGESVFTPTQAIAEVVRILTRFGFAAQTTGQDPESPQIMACSCPFEEMAFHDPARVCGLDRSIWRGVLSVYAPGATLGTTAARAEGDEACVAEVVTPSS
jgi:predicted ArsR family transcriptional regulator